jgi:murein L,D-transpeptidase YafK
MKFKRILEPFHYYLFAALLGIFSLAAVVVGDAANVQVELPIRLELTEPRVVILKSARKLHLFDGADLVRTYDIALGFNPVGQKMLEGDGRTPLGQFRICTKNPDSAYSRFMGIDYPDPPAALRALRSGLISAGEYSGIMSAHQDQRCPIWTSALGGGIGIHGNGTRTDWTAGCVALDDHDMEELFDVLRLGDPVEILR